MDDVTDHALDTELRERKAKRLALTPHDVTILPIHRSLSSDPELLLPKFADHVTRQSGTESVKTESAIGSSDVIVERGPSCDVLGVGGTLATSRSADRSPPPDDGSTTSGFEEISHVTEVSGIRVILEEVDLWQTFYKSGTEMIINRPGRRMFPSVVVSIRGLSPLATYKLTMDIIPADDRRYKYVNNRWTAVGKADPEIRNPSYVHPDSPSSGKIWMQTKVSFSKIKITNNKESEEGNVTIVQVRNGEDDAHARYVFPLTLTTFIAVTAYQSENIVQMKIRNNPFAKAFRDSDLTGMLQRQAADGLISGCIEKRERETDMTQNRKSPCPKRPMNVLQETMTLGAGYTRLPALTHAGFSPDYPAMVAPPSSLVRSELLNYYGGIPGAMVAPPAIGLQNLSLFERNEATYRWLCACSQNLTAQAQSIRMRALAMLSQGSFPAYERHHCSRSSESATSLSRVGRGSESPKTESQ
ncbi:hypothetical protein LSH36_939g00027 [Paralvinella palmiformis]|uniref:T-box domain-containing protein n=1 Tax=Paralvinella palmiformis TaxID=53620 RepID=A0AAD9MQU3_9ANNE|nr:hypothetical protein LSH36_939g00027 [Paralvinella palmiformis]